MGSVDVHELKQRLQVRAAQLGYQRIGVARAEALGVEAERLHAWLSAGRHGEMKYMPDTEQVRADVRHPGMLPSARSVIVLATAYARAAPPSGPAPAKVARYAQGRDYHNLLYKRAKKLASLLKSADHAVRVGVDSLPIFERAWAQRAGVGFIGKNCCLIVPGLGSHVLLSTLVTSAELPVDEPLKERCGACSLCLDACPTRAFVAPRELDARRCISYLTIEQRGPVPLELREAIGSWLFGCDVCQDVCPYNKTSVVPDSQTEPFAADARWQRHDATDLLRMSEETFADYAAGSPLKRPGRLGVARNAAVVLGNVGTRRHLPVLDELATSHDSPAIRETIAWAAARIRDRTKDAP